MSTLFDLFRHRPGRKPEDGGDPGTEERREMIRGVEDLADTTVKEVMVPRTDTVFLPLDADRDHILRTVVESGHSRIPVHGETVDDVAGILYAKDLLAALVRGGEFRLPDILRTPFFVPETKRIDSLLREFKRRRVHIAVVVDEYGGMSGIVCLEDIIEEIVGEIQDEFDDEAEDIVAVGEGSWLCDARIRLDDLAEVVGTDFPVDEFDSLGGYVFDLFGRIPAPGERVDTNGLAFTAQSMDGHRIISVRIDRLDGAGRTGDPGGPGAESANGD